MSLVPIMSRDVIYTCCCELDWLVVGWLVVFDCF